VDVPSPAAKRLALPRWLNVRLGVGVLLVLLSTLLGARALAGTDRGQLVWAANRALPAGYALTARDVAPVRVRLGSASARYVAALGPAPTGYLLDRAVAAGELVPRAALMAAADASPQRRVVAVPVESGHWPHGLGPGDLVDVYATARSSGGAATGQAVLVLAAVPVQSVPSDDAGIFGRAGATTSAVELSTPSSDVPALVAAVESSSIDLVRVWPDEGRGGGRSGSSAVRQP
jgi:hypothetical protein